MKFFTQTFVENRVYTRYPNSVPKLTTQRTRLIINYLGFAYFSSSGAKGMKQYFNINSCVPLE